MKKQLICTMAIAAIMSTVAAASALAEGVKYDLDNNSVNVQGQAAKKTVLITDVSGNIVYVDQAASVFDAAKEFKIKSNPNDGVYTIRLGAAEGNALTKTFCIGMSQENGDVKLEKPAVDAIATNSDGTMNIGYKEDNAPQGTYRTLIIKKSDESYYGIELGTVITLSENSAIGIQINGVLNENEISSVWLSDRGIVTAAPSSTQE